MARKAISKKIRFEVFKRDNFTCQYCGATPPQVILHVDHIVAVARGGENDMDNYATSCESCNQGKAANSLTSVPQSLKSKAADISEREEQLRGYHAVIEAKRNRIEDESWDVAEILEPGSIENGFNRRNLISIRSFVEKLGVFETMDAAEIAKAKFPWPTRKLFLYFCGICWRKLRESQNG